MDRFKFRVWSKQSNSYIKEKMFYIDRFGGLFKYEKSKSTVYINAPSPYVMCLCGDNYIVEQCTGLKDKNGKLIYEGDIVRVLEQYKTNTTEQLYPMMFNKKVAKFGFKHPDGHFFYFTNNEDFSYEVIGNIHENPDLLGEE